MHYKMAHCSSGTGLPKAPRKPLRNQIYKHLLRDLLLKQGKIIQNSGCSRRTLDAVFGEKLKTENRFNTPGFPPAFFLRADKPLVCPRPGIFCGPGRIA